MSLSAWLEESLKRNSSLPAIDSNGLVVSYEELGRETERLAVFLGKAGISRGSRVVLEMERSVPAIQLILAALRLGAAYVPLDPRLPPARKERLLKLVEPAFVVSGEGGRPQELQVRRPSAPEAPGAAAYCLFTSGTTGEPKVVEISQDAAAAFPKWAAEYVGLRPGDRVAGLSPLSFDLSTFELFSTLGSGATLVPVPPGASSFPVQLLEFLKRERISVLYGVPSVFRFLSGLASPGRLDSLRAVLSAGDRFPADAMEKLGPAFNGRFYNFYGPTETNVCLAAEWKPGSGEAPIGTPAAGSRCQLLIDGPVEAGEETGELLVAGPTLMTGYLGSPSATEAAFFEAENGERFYRTGDLVRKDRNGVFWLIGRKNGLAKVHGYRVHPAEVEEALRGLEGLVDCAVLALPDPAAGQLLHAALASGSSGLPERAEERLRELLPAYMLPHAYTVLPTLPYLSNGKVNREALLNLLRREGSLV